jgi:hypothetical protein
VGGGFVVKETNVRQRSGEKEKLQGISKKKYAFCGKKYKCLHVEAKL